MKVSRHFSKSFDTDADEHDRRRMERLAARYFLDARYKGNEPLVPVARFHLKNGAMLERINVLGDPTENGMERSYGLKMSNRVLQRRAA